MTYSFGGAGGGVGATTTGAGAGAGAGAGSGATGAGVGAGTTGTGTTATGDGACATVNAGRFGQPVRKSIRPRATSRRLIDPSRPRMSVPPVNSGRSGQGSR